MASNAELAATVKGLRERVRELESASVAQTCPGIQLNVEPDIFARWTPLGGGKWRIECNAYRQDVEVEGPDVGAHDGTWLILKDLFFDHLGHPHYEYAPTAPLRVDEQTDEVR